MLDLFSQFANQFKPKEEPKTEPKEKTTQEIRDRNDRYEAYRKSRTEYLSLKDFIALEERENAVEGLESMSQFEKKQRRLADKQRIEALTGEVEETPLPHVAMKNFIEEGFAKIHSETPKIEKPSEMMERLLKEKNTPPPPVKIDLDLIDFSTGKTFKSWDGENIVESNEAPPSVTVTVTPDNYSSMPLGLKEAQERNGVRDHMLGLYLSVDPAVDEDTVNEAMVAMINDGQVITVSKIDDNGDFKQEVVKMSEYYDCQIESESLELEVEPLPEPEVQWEDFDEPVLKEKKVRVFKKDFPTPERTQTVKQRAYVGIDNGVSGSVGIIYEDGTYEFFVTPVKKEQDYTKAKKLINRVQPLELADLFKYVGEGSMVMIERPMINSTRFNASMSAIRCFEATITILETLGLPYQVEDSKAWQKALLPIGISGDDLKKASKDVGNRLFPNTKLILHPDCDGMLIANYCKSKHR